MRILFYDDAAVFGGHEVMTLHAVEYLLQKTRDTILFVLSEANLRLIERLESFQADPQRLIIRSVPYRSGSFQGIRALCSFRRVTDISRLLRSLNPDVIVVVQGSIEISSLGLLASRRAGYPTITYIPFGHTMRVTGAALAPARDLINRYLYQRPDRYITLSDSIAEALRAQHVTAPINVVYNCIDPCRYRREDRADARRRLNLPSDAWTLGMVGRVHFQQKGQDILLRCLAKNREAFEGTHLLVVGDGPDAEAMGRLIRSLDVQQQVTCLSWSQDLSTVYSALDAAVIPSRYEGLPLVMLEAMHYELPVIAANCDGMKDVLPAEWLFRVGDEDALADAITRVRNRKSPLHASRLKTQVEDQFSLENFGATFHQAIQDAADTAR
jgi:glycosyltransferase involved in cell wall biosynthesis